MKSRIKSVGAIVLSIIFGLKCGVKRETKMKCYDKVRLFRQNMA